MRLCLICLVVFPSVWVGCSPVSRTSLKKKFRETETKFQDHTGFMLYDPESGETLFEHHSSRYFTPASNTKIFTLYAAFNVLGDSIPGLRYAVLGDSLIFTGTGDPSFLYGNVYNNDRTYNFLRTARQQLYYAEANWQTTHFGPGWSWEDYDYTFSSMRSSLPMYGNTFEVIQVNDSILARPRYFSSFLLKTTDTLTLSKLVRSPFSNQTIFYPGKTDKVRKWTKPFITDSSVIINLLTDTLRRKVTLVHDPPVSSWTTLFSVPADSLYRVMMQDSDNFVAEQLLLLCSGVLSDSLKPEIAIDYTKEMLLGDLPDEPIWMDGSGLSRYNLFTPRSLVMLWEKLLRTVPRQRLFSLLATGGVSGTLRYSYKGESPYIFGKTGTLSNVHCLSGYIVTKSGRTLIFSFMNTNFTTPAHEVRTTMQEIMKLVHDYY
ncbi:MAG TPA: D-alanyl-D-alanine carboxypeptidase [Cyclobacteriaceae bacterium]